jgi:hypothetical protein
MYRARQQRPAPRRGIVLLVVLALLTLFAIVGISFVLYANSEANASRYARESESPPQPDMDPELLLSMFMGQLIYDADDDTGIYSAMRGYSLARNMYGYYYRRPVTPTMNDPTFQNIYPFSGTGRLRGVPIPPGITGAPKKGPDSYISGTQVTQPPFDDYYLINYTYFGKFLRDPERPGYRNGPTDTKQPYRGGFNPPYTYPDLNNMFLAAVKAGPLELPGLTIDAKTAAATAGAVLIQSFHRPWLFGSLNSNNPNWKNDVGKYLILRPRPQDMAPGFPYPDDEGGDVKNLINSPGYLVGLDPKTQKPIFANNDSIWMDLGAPVMTAPDGTKFKPLFAPLIIDLDNRINLNVHGNIRGRSGTHASNQGWGPWEVNLGRVLNYLNQPNEWAQIFMDFSSGGTPIEGGRYYYGDPRFGHIPLSTFPLANTAGAGDRPHYWGPVDFDACDENQGFGASGLLQTYLSPTPNANGTYRVPSFPDVPNGYGEGSATERRNHPLVFNFFNPYQDPPPPYGNSDPNKRNLVFPISNMEALLRYGETNSPGLTSSLFRLCAQNLGDPTFEQIPVADPVDPQGMRNKMWTGGASRRQLVTTHSFAMDRVGMSPWFWGNRGADPNTILSFGRSNGATSQVWLDYKVNAAQTPFFPTANPIPSPNPQTITGQQLRGGDFEVGKDKASGQWQSDWKSANAILSKLDLNRKLTPYPVYLSNPAQAFNAVTNPVNVYNPNDARLWTQYKQAEAERRKFAEDILRRLMAATGAYDPQNPPRDAAGKVIAPTAQYVYAVAYLAQLAVNIVDYIDGDDIMTGLPWLDLVDSAHGAFWNKAITPIQSGGCGFIDDASRWVWGTELPRVLINEVYGEFKVISGNPTTTKDATYQVDMWVELYNPLSNDSAQADPTRGYAYLRVPGSVAAPGTNGGTYRIELYRPPQTPPNNTPVPTLHRMSNPTGEPEPLWLLQRVPTGNQPCRVDQFVAAPANTNNVPPADLIAPSGGLYSTPNWTMGVPTPGFYVLGPMSDFPSAGMGPPKPPTANHRDPSMTYQMTQKAGGGAVQVATLTQTQKPDSAGTTPALPTVVLQRLANPYIPFNATSNPYVTVDFVEGIKPQNAGPQNLDQTGFIQLAMRHSSGKVDPFNSIGSSLRPAGPTPANVGQPQHTFFRHNGASATTPARGNLSLPFTWMPHPDRQLISPMELLTVSAYKPAELTQRFLLGSPTDPRHFAPWLGFSSNGNGSAPNLNRLYRFFEFVETNNRATGVARGGRIPGQVNLNTVWDPETLMALIDPQPGNYFWDPDVYKSLGQENMANPTSVYWRMMKLRSPSALAGTSPDFRDQPFLGNAPGVVPPGDVQYPQGTGVANSFLRLDSQNRPVFQRTPQPAHDTMLPDSVQPNIDPSRGNTYVANGILHKLFNNVTTRSNVFAVWVTVGFFQVVDDTTRPVKLGAEIGKAENRNIRHRMFAIVDRSNLTIGPDVDSSAMSGPPVFLEANVETMLKDPNQPDNPLPTIPVLSIAGAKFSGAAGNAKLSGSYEEVSWAIGAGSHLQLEPLPGATNPVRAQVVSVNPPNSVVDNFKTPPTPISSPTITLLPGTLGIPQSGVAPGITSPMYVMPVSPEKWYILGNPGPKPGFNLRDYSWVIRYFSIIN